MSARTWEEATQGVAIALPSWREGAELSLDDVLQDIEEVLDDLRHSDNSHEASQFRYLAWLGAVGYVLEKWGDARTFDFVGACDNVVCDVLVLLPKKQHDYGPDNILWGGVQGVVVRAHDKLARIKNLKKRAEMIDAGPLKLQPAMRSGGPLNESLTDSYFDLIGYGIVGAMLVKGTFQLPLEADLPLAVGHPERAAKEGAATAALDNYFSPGEREAIRQIALDEMAKREHSKVAKHRTIGTGKTYG